MSAQPHRQAHVQGLRALAVVIVVAYHSHVGMSGGFVGVDVFFVISGYVISRLLLTELELTGSVRLCEFFSRRVRRLLPALTAMLVIVCVLALLFLGPLGPQAATSNTATGASLFGANLQLFAVKASYFDLDSETNALLHTWSLGVEEQFYFLFPIVLLAAWHLRARRTVLAGTIASLGAASFALSWLTSHGYAAELAHRLGGGVTKFAFYMPVTRAWEFCGGVLIGLAARAPRRGVGVAMTTAGFVLVAATAFSLNGTEPFPGTVALAPAIGTALLLFGGLQPRTPISWLLSQRPIVWIGDLSYGWYLWHWPFIVFARSWFPHNSWVAALAACVAVVPAWASYRFIEQPIRRIETLRGFKAVALAIVCIVSSLAAAGALRWIGRAERASLAPDFIAAAEDMHLGARRGCADGPALEELARCTSGERGGANTVLVGDSNADQFAEPLEAIATERKHALTIAVRTACPFVDALVHIPGRSAKSCLEHVHRMMKHLLATRPAVVVIASASSVYLNNPAISIEDPHTREVATTREQRLALWTASVQSIVGQLAAAKIRVIVVHTVPNLPGFAPATCPFLRAYREPLACSLVVSRQQIEEQQRDARAAERAAVANIDGASTLDVTERLCTSTECAAWRSNVWLYRDEGHLSVEGSRTLTPVFRDAIPPIERAP